MVETQHSVEKMYIDGEWEASLSGEFLEVVNPANNETIGSVAYGGRKEASRAIQAAENSFMNWKNLTAKERGSILEEIYNLMIQERKELAYTLTLEQGKPLKEAEGEINQAADFVKWYAEEGKRLYGNVIPQSDSDKRILTWYEPVGVTAAITPWNFPISMVTRKLAPALSAGCTVVLKPAEATPLSAIKLFEL